MDTTITCPRCGSKLINHDTCLKCGEIINKVKPYRKLDSLGKRHLGKRAATLAQRKTGNPEPAAA